MDLAPKLIDVHVPDAPEGAVLVLHGGASRRDGVRVSPTQLSVLRMVPIAQRIARAGGDRLAVFRLLNSARGWDTEHTPVADARWALGEIGTRLGGLPPVCLVGHSLGGRAAILSVTAPGVLGAVALAPWVYETDVPPGLDDQRVLVVHGDRDRIASPDRSAALTAALVRAGADAGYVTVEGGKHAMLGRHRVFSDLAADFATRLLLGEPASRPIARIEAGEPAVVV